MQISRFGKAVLLGFSGALFFVALSIVLETEFQIYWPGRIAFSLGAHLFPHARNAGILPLGGEGIHHGFVLWFSFVIWALAFSAVLQLLLKRQRP
jgi:hypothetical protein